MERKQILEKLKKQDKRIRQGELFYRGVILILSGLLVYFAFQYYQHRVKIKELEQTIIRMEQSTKPSGE